MKEVTNIHDRVRLDAINPWISMERLRESAEAAADEIARLTALEAKLRAEIQRQSDDRRRLRGELTERERELGEAREALIKIHGRDWTDQSDDLTPIIDAEHPVLHNDFKTFERALSLVNNRHSKYALVALVAVLLRRIGTLIETVEGLAEFPEETEPAARARAFLDKGEG